MTGLVARVLARLRARNDFPFDLEQLSHVDSQVNVLFQASFGSAPPDFPLHFVARWGADGSVRGYVHYTRHEPGVYLCGGLCVDARPYREMSKEDRALLKDAGSLSRWLLRHSIERLPDKKAVFAYTGNTMSIRDGLASGFVDTGHRHLIVQWHGAVPPERPALLERIAALGPF